MEILSKDIPDMLDMQDLQRVLRIGRSKAYELIKQGEILYFKAGRKIIIPKRYLLDFIENSLILCYNDKVMVSNPTRQERGNNNDG